MAFNRNPQFNTYQTKTIKLMKEVDTRNSDPSLQDEDYVNVYFEVIKNRLTGENDQYIVKRAGTSTFGVAGTYSNIRGTFYWEDLARLYVAAGRDLLYYDVTTGAIGATYVNFFAGSTSDVGFTTFLYDTNTVTLIVVDGTTLNEITSAGAITTCIDGDIPSPHVAAPVFLDGYLFLLKTGTADVYNSDLNNPQSWDPAGFLTAEMNPDVCVTISRLNNYMAVFGSDSIEYFWDAANPAPGTPMKRNDTPVKNTGYLGGLSQFGNKIYFIGNEDESQPAAYVLEDFKMKKISSTAFERYLASLTTAYTSYKCSFLSFNGHTFYLVNAGSKTFIMDLATELWTRFDWQSSGTGFLVIGAANTKSTTTYKSIIALSGTGQLYQLSPTIYQDSGTNFLCTMITPANEFDTMNRKFWHRLTIWCDRPRANSNMSISWTDDDWISYNTTPLTVNLNQDIPCVYRLGQARQRAFKLTYLDNYPMRIKQIEVDINVGQT